MNQSSETRTTTDRDEIRRWVEGHDGRPVTVRGTESAGEGAGVLRIDFSGGASGGGEDDRLDPVEWDDWFQELDDAGLAFLHQERRADGGDSTSVELVSR
jgi:hypothetical protein